MVGAETVGVLCDALLSEERSVDWKLPPHPIKPVVRLSVASTQLVVSWILQFLCP